MLLALTHVWYRMAVAGTDDWAAAVQALVNLGRKPLSEALGLAMPDSLAKEREMWRLIGRLAGRPYRDSAAVLDEFRTKAERETT